MTIINFIALSGHGSHILSLYNWGGAMFVSGSQVSLLKLFVHTYSTYLNIDTFNRIKLFDFGT